MCEKSSQHGKSYAVKYNDISKEQTDNRNNQTDTNADQQFDTDSH